MAVTIANTVGENHRESQRHRQVLWVFALTLFTSALLLFGVQPLFAKIVLPRLGGSTAVWSIALVFFQGVLLLGYLYAHIISTRLKNKHAIGVHLVVLIAAFAFLPLAYPQGWEQPPTEGLSIWVIGLFAVGVGFPFFAISANAPLLQIWFSRTGHPQGNDPYFLYGASNIGSFISLLAYPFLIEPITTLSSQTFGWSVIFILLCAGVAICGFFLWQTTLTQTNAVGVEKTNAPNNTLKRISIGEKATWVALAAVPSGLLVSVTAFITTDLVSAPFLWIIPLALFLLTFVITFQKSPIIPHKRALQGLTFVVAPIAIVLFIGTGNLVMASLHLLVFFVCALVCHGELVKRRPPAEYLTHFYLWMSFGGVLGGLVASLVAPLIFSNVWEYPIFLALVFFCQPKFWRFYSTMSLRKIALFAPVAIVFGLAAISPDLISSAASSPVFVIGLLIAIISTFRFIPQQTALVVFGISIVVVGGFDHSAVSQVRSFYGVNTVVARQDGQYHLLVHGKTMHGAERILDDNLNAITTRPEPLTYYYREGGLSSAIRIIRSNTGKLGNVAVIGLGTGAMACEVLPGEKWKYFEIDPEVIKIARNKSLFRFLSECGESDGIVAGDGRITIGNEPHAKFDIIVLDAFSSDSIPVHLITRQALEIYFSKLKPEGTMVFHISNRYLELASVVSSVARSLGAQTLITKKIDNLWQQDKASFKIAPLVAVVSKSNDALEKFRQDGRWFQLRPDEMSAPWNDDYANILGAIVRRSRSGLVPARYRN